MIFSDRPPAHFLDAAKRLARLTIEHKRNQHVYPHDALQGLIGALTWGDYHPERTGLPGADAVTMDDISDGLALFDFVRFQLAGEERKLIEIAKDRGMTWVQLGAIFGQSAQAAQQRYKRLGGTRSWPTPPPRRVRRIEPGADPQTPSATVTYSICTDNDDGWREVGRTQNLKADVAIAAVADERISVSAKEWGIAEGEPVKVAVLDEAGKQIDAFTTTAIGMQ